MIKELKNKETELSLFRYKAILESVPDIIMEVNNEKEYTWANTAGLAFFGNDVVGKKADYYFEGDQDTLNKVKPVFMGTENTIYVESWQRRYDGEKRLLAWWCRTLKNEKDEVIGAISSARDITEDKKTHEEIIRSKELLQKIIDLLPIRIFWKDLDFKYLGCNNIFARDAGKNDPKEIIGKDDFDMTWKDQAEIYRNDDQEVINSGRGKLNFEEPQTTPDGNTIWLKTSKVPLVDYQGNIMGVLGVYEDITEYKKATDILKKKMTETEELNKMMVGREMKMIELKREVELLKKKMEERK